MRLTRCYVPAALASDSTITLPAEASAHIARVLRLRVGAGLTLFDGRGGEYEGQILSLERAAVRVRVGAHHPIERESPLTLRLLQCLARGERMDLIVQKATELGVTDIVPVVGEHSVVRLDAAAADRRLRHWQTIAFNACEQCGRNRPPQLHPLLEFDSACAAEQALAGQAGAPHALWLLSPEAESSLANAVMALRPAISMPRLSLLVGPEGGFRADELARARHHGFAAVSLGPRVLRAETAPLAALASIQTLLGDFAASGIAR